jgi:hypothetical protein
MLTLNTNHDIHEVYNEYAASAVLFDHLPTQSELEELCALHKDDYFWYKPGALYEGLELSPQEFISRFLTVEKVQLYGS